MINEQSIKTATTHLHMLYGMANSLNGAYGSEAVHKLMKLYAETFNHITTEILPQLGMSEETIEELVAGIDESFEPLLYKPSVITV